MARPLASLLGVVCLCVACNAQDLKDLRLSELLANCRTEIKSGMYSPVQFKNIKIEDLQVLAWYRARDDRPWYVDNALIWGKLTTDQGPRWVLVHMARNPMNQLPQQDRKWHSYFVYDVPNSWFLYFDKAPTDKDIDLLTWFHFRKEPDWIVYDSSIDEKAWTTAFGKKPNKQFPKPSELKTQRKSK